ncbi:MAG: hypothetical protein ACXW3O_07205 [Brevundimonas sp.]
MKTAMIRKALLSTLAATAVMTATPALAQNVTFSIGVGSPAYGQSYGYNPRYGYDRRYGDDLQYRAQHLAQQINRVAYNGRISRGEAQRLSWEMQQYRSLEWRYARDGRLTQREYAALSYRLDRIQAMLRMARRHRW